MKKFISALILVLSPIAFAQTSPDGIRLFSVKKAQFAPEHIASFSSGTVQVDYERNVVTMAVSRTLPCPSGQVCTMMVQPPMIEELPISSIEQKQCGVRQITALQEDPSSSGLVKTISVTDASDVFCRTLALYQSHAEYETSQLDHASGERNSVRSLMLLEEISSENQQ